MIPGLYAWAKYVAKKDNIQVDDSKIREDFHKAIEMVISGSYNIRDLETIYEPIAHLFEKDPNSIKDKYVFKIKEKSIERNITSEEMKYVMVPKKGSTGKTMQSIGGSIFARHTLKKATKEADVKYKEVGNKHEVTFQDSKDSLLKFWRQRLLDTYFQSTENLIGQPTICPFCGTTHKFKNLRFNPPINIFVEDVTNYNSYLSNEPSHSICPFCNMLFLRTVVEEKGPHKIPFPQAKNAYIYLLPYDNNEDIYKIFEKEKAEEFLKNELQNQGWRFKELDALNYLLSLPLFVYRNLPISLGGKIKPSIYIIFADKSKQAEEICESFIVTRFDYLGIVGKLINEKGGIKEVYNFQKRLLTFVDKFKKEQKVNGYKLIFRFIGKILSEGEIDFTFLHSILRREITHSGKEKIYLSGYNYLNAFLEAKKEVQNV
ncbi:MAG: hypothetical protein ACP5K0_05535 [Thermosulfidibacteraceae bacterium]|jgi:hypothetical protein|uniref:hypothetical protein n=1 Tax=Thermovenabulum sp. TaxID=3100335 RepID=UPI003C7A94B1